MAVNPAAKDADLIVPMAGQVSRFTGHNCPTALMQFAIERVIDETSDLGIYEKNAKLLYDELTRIGYKIVKPMGTFYMMPRVPGSTNEEPRDANDWCWKTARSLGLITVPGDSFYCPGHFRISYCVPTEMIEEAIPLFEEAYNF